jgi:hypothetical protein
MWSNVTKLPIDLACGTYLKDVRGLAFPKHSSPFLDHLLTQVPPAPVPMTAHLETKPSSLRRWI